MIDLKYVWIRNYESVRTIEEHFHQGYEIVYYLKGKGTCLIENDKYEYCAGSIALIPPNLRHKEIHKELTSMIAIGFTTDKFSELSSTIFLQDEKTIFFDMVQKIRYDFKSKEIYFKENIENVIGMILIEFIRRLKNSTKKKKSDLDYFTNYFKEYHMNKLNIKEIAKDAGYSPDHFCVLFKEQTGYTPKEYIQNERFLAAKKMLEEDQKSLNEVAERCGFDYYCEFASFFKKKANISPLKYRKLHSKTN